MLFGIAARCQLHISNSKFEKGEVDDGEII
jgi:hypothetical protein